MAAYTLNRRVHPTAVAGSIDTITIPNRDVTGIEVFNETTGPMWITTGNATVADPVAAGDDVDYVPAGGWVVVPLPRTASTVKVLALANGGYHLTAVTDA
jgi:hypothetical protein